MRRGPAILRVCGAVAAATFALAGCGGDDDDGADDTTYTVDVVHATFPPKQRLAKPATFEIALRNAGSARIPNLAVTLHGFAERSADAPRGSLWIVDSSPAGVTASTETWTAGPLEPDATATLRWVVTPIAPGPRTLSYEVAAGLRRSGRVRLSNGRAARGSIPVRVTAKPANARVDPRTGGVIRADE